MTGCDALYSELLPQLLEGSWRSNKMILAPTSFLWDTVMDVNYLVSPLEEALRAGWCLAWRNACSLQTYQRLENVLAAAVCSLACVYVFRRKKKRILTLE
jgi:hypothetical protein